MFLMKSLKLLSLVTRCVKKTITTKNLLFLDVVFVVRNCVWEIAVIHVSEVDIIKVALMLTKQDNSG